MFHDLSDCLDDDILLKLSVHELARKIRSLLGPAGISQVFPPLACSGMRNDAFCCFPLAMEFAACFVVQVVLHVDGVRACCVNKTDAIDLKLKPFRSWGAWGLD